MVTYWLQVVVALLSLGIGAVALRVHHRFPRVGEDEPRSGWLLVAAAFVVAGINGVVHNLFGGWALLEGRDSLAGAVWGRVHPMGNYGRSFTFLAFGAMLLFPAVWRGAAAAGSWRRVSVPLLLCMGVGTLVGFVESPFQLRHYLSLSVVDLVSVVLLLGALLRAAMRDTLDYLLWVGLAAFALRDAVAIHMLSPLAWQDSAWFPSVRALQALGVAAYLVLLGCALRRLSLARRGAAVPALFELGRARPPAPERH